VAVEYSKEAVIKLKCAER